MGENVIGSEDWCVWMHRGGLCVGCKRENSHQTSVYSFRSVTHARFTVAHNVLVMKEASEHQATVVEILIFLV